MRTRRMKVVRERMDSRVVARVKRLIRRYEQERSALGSFEEV